MFEALFILTAIDAGTRVGRFLMQDLLSYVWKPLGSTTSAAVISPPRCSSSPLGLVPLPGRDRPARGIRSLWPIFGVANQLLAVIALALGTTVLIKMGRARYAWVTLAPLLWLLVVTMTRIHAHLSANPRLGFLAQAASLAQKLPGAARPSSRRWRGRFQRPDQCGGHRGVPRLRRAGRARLRPGVVAAARRRRTADLHEEPYVPLAGVPSAK